MRLPERVQLPSSGPEPHVTAEIRIFAHAIKNIFDSFAPTALRRNGTQEPSAHTQYCGCLFRTFAPGAERVSLIGDCTGGRELPMEKAYDGNFFECFLPHAKEGDCYEYRIYHGGSYTDHCDPYGFGMELRPAHRSVIRSLEFDFSEVEYVSSAGLRVLLAAQKVMKRQGTMVLRGVSDAVMEVFEITGFVDILTIV